MSRQEAKTKGKKVTAKSGSEYVTLPAYPDRQWMAITNYGEKLVTYALGSSAVYGEGPALAEKGGSVILQGYGGAVTLVTTSGESAVGYSEF